MKKLAILVQKLAIFIFYYCVGFILHLIILFTNFFYKIIIYILEQNIKELLDDQYHVFGTNLPIFL